MDWNGTFVSRPQPTLNSHYNYNYDQCPGVLNGKLNSLIDRLYDPLKHDYDVISRENSPNLNTYINSHTSWCSASHEMESEETVESTSVPSSNKSTVAASPHVPIPECNYVFNLLTVGAKLPSYP
ncbi:hypothetical protein CXB51_022667 [Gossypium anomalum]|uniref:Uncharacterized protein n=1 Tax=Gossypium anomalum TaxID=47600 RepID=A0A8J5YF12_9ROSI|nr:hypothetical protein CXB51_022667 [Gossypium anomalum]